jgi:hypothetical protein
VGLLHVNAFTALMLDDLLTGWEKRGVRFVSLDRALEDPAYAHDPGVGATDGDSLLEQEIAGRRAPHPPWLLQPLALLGILCGEARP